MGSEKRDTPQTGREKTHFDRVLDEARAVAGRALAHLRRLSEDLPDGVVEQVEQLHANAGLERRKAVRVSDPSLAVAVRAADFPEEATAIKNHGPTGLAVLLACPAGVGTVLRLRLPPELGGDAWVTVEVKHCRKEGDGWIAGCELLGPQPPL